MTQSELRRRKKMLGKQEKKTREEVACTVLLALGSKLYGAYDERGIASYVYRIADEMIKKREDIDY